MNLILLDAEAQHVRWEVNDRRAVHVREILGLGVGESFFVGVENGLVGKALIQKDDASGMALEVEARWESPAPLPIHLLIGLPRPQTARKLLREIPSLGPGQVTFFLAEKAERSYQQSKLWTTQEWSDLLRTGAEQAFSTRLPTIHHTASLAEAIRGVDGDSRIAFDLYETSGTFDRRNVQGMDRLALAFGPEGGWTPTERKLLRGSDFELLGLGPRVLRVETAVVAATSMAAAFLERLEPPLIPNL